MPKPARSPRLTAPAAKLVLAVLASASPTGACSSLEAKPPPPVEVVVHVTSDPGQVVEGAVLTMRGAQVGKTDAKGSATLRLRGRDGDATDIAVKCPEGFVSPERPTSVTIRRLVGAKATQVDVVCPPEARTVVVAVRADNGANVPVMYLGQEVGRTDASGAAHVVVKVKDDEPFALQLKTDADKEHERLKPKNPQMTFAAKHQDDVFVFDQKFEAPPAPGRRRGPVRKGPTRIP